MSRSRESLAKISSLTVTLVIFIWTVATSSIQGQILGVVLLALVVWSLYPRWHSVSSIFIIAILFLFQVSFSVSEFLESLFSTYGESGLWIIVSGFILSQGMSVSGLARRIALWIVSTLGGDPDKVVLSVAVANLAVAPLSPSTTAKAFLLLPICVGLIQAFGVEKSRSRYGAAVMLMCLSANNICSTGFLTATVPNPISAGYLRDAYGLELGWLDWLVMALPLTLVLLFCSWLLLRWMFKPEMERTRSLDKISGFSFEVGPLSRSEVIVGLVFIASLILWITEELHGLNSGLISLGLSLTLFLPWSGIIKIGKFAGDVPWGSIFLFAASMFLARAVSRWRALDPVAERLFQVFNLSRLSFSFFISLSVIVFMLIHVVFTSTTVFSTVMVPLAISLAGLQGLQTPLLAIPVAFLTPIALILPVNTIPNLVFHSVGYFTQKQLLYYGLVMSILSAVLIISLGVPYWRLLGLV